MPTSEHHARARMVRALTPAMQAILPAEDIRHLQASKTVITGDAKVAIRALAGVLPLQLLVWRQQGTGATGTAVDGMRTLPQAALLRRIDVLSTTAPAGSNITARLWNVTTASEIDRVNVVAGQRAGMSGESIPLDASTQLSVDILAVGSTTAGQDITVQVAYLPVLE